MFTNLVFKMVNSIGVMVSVSLKVSDGIVFYSINYNDNSHNALKEEKLSHKNSAKLLQKIDQLKLIEALSQYQAFGLDEGGSYWEIHINYLLGQINLSGPENSHSVIVPLIDSFADLLDSTFIITQFISPTRLERVEIEFVSSDSYTFDENDSEEVIEACMHRELVILDRKKNSFEYTRHFPSRCCHAHFGCRCDEEVRILLDKTEQIFVSESLFEDIETSDNSPSLRFTFVYHDGSSAYVHRHLSFEGLGEVLYTEFLDEIFENILKLMFKHGLFDKRMIMTDFALNTLPFFVVYAEDGAEKLVDELEEFNENCSMLSN